ncbi:MAG: DUF1801 domain-containing protein [Ferruginibacter sp.]
MEANAKKFVTVDEYIGGFPTAVKRILKQIRKTIKEAAPGAEELISYNMPAFKFHGALVYYAAYKMHIGFYPASSAIRELSKDLGNYQVSKGTIRFQLDEVIPYDLITKIVKFRVAENLQKEKDKLKAKKLVKVK